MLTYVKELMTGPTSYKGTIDASGEGAGGMWVRKLSPPFCGNTNGPKQLKTGLSHKTTPPVTSPILTWR